MNPMRFIVLSPRLSGCRGRGCAGRRASGRRRRRSPATPRRRRGGAAGAGAGGGRRRRRPPAAAACRAAGTAGCELLRVSIMTLRDVAVDLLHGVDVHAVARHLRRLLVFGEHRREALRVALGLRDDARLVALGLLAQARRRALRLRDHVAGVGLAFVLQAVARPGRPSACPRTPPAPARAAARSAR